MDKKALGALLGIENLFLNTRAFPYCISIKELLLPFCGALETFIDIIEL